MAVEMAGPWGEWKTKSRFPTLPSGPWKSRQHREIPTFPRALFEASQGWWKWRAHGESGKPRAGFPHSPPALGNLANTARFPHSHRQASPPMGKWKTRNRFPTSPRGARDDDLFLYPTHKNTERSTAGHARPHLRFSCSLCIRTKLQFHAHPSIGKCSARRHVFVPLQARRIDAGDIWAAIFIEVDHGACRGSHAALVQIAPRPAFRRGVVVVEVDAVRLPTEAGNDFVHAIAVEVGNLDGVAVNEAAVDHFALPLRAALGVDRDLVAVPGFDGRQKSRLCLVSTAQVPDGDIAGTGFRPRRGVALGDFGARPARIFRIAEEVDAGETGAEDALAAVAVPIGHEDAVHHARVLGRDHATLPLAGDVVHQRRLIAIVGRGCGGAGERGVDHDEFTRAIDIGGAQAVGGGQAVDFGDRPGFAGIGARAEDADNPGAVPGFVLDRKSTRLNSSHLG